MKTSEPSTAAPEGLRGTCDRCAKPVRKSEDATLWEETLLHLTTGRRPFVGFTVARHIACSPSRQQYFGGPRQPTYNPQDAAPALVAAEILRAAVDFDPARTTYEEHLRELTKKRRTTPPV